MHKRRIRDLGISIGPYPTGPWNAITDVPDVLVGHQTIMVDEPRVGRTGVTIVSPRQNNIFTNFAFAGWHSFNGNGEMTGIPWIEESGMLGSPIGITNTFQVGVVRDALIRYAEERGMVKSFFLPVVAETYDGYLSDIGGFHVQESDVMAAITSATSGPVAEGNVGGGTGMICHEFKGGIGSSSRLVDVNGTTYTVGVLVQANYGARSQLRIAGVPIGERIPVDDLPGYKRQASGNSIIVIIATDAPLLPMQCRRLAQRATVGLARVGGTGHSGSGDIFIAFATGNELPADYDSPRPLSMLPLHHMNGLIDATADTVEESILNALCAADTMTGFQDRTIHALPLDRVAAILGQKRS